MKNKKISIPFDLIVIALTAISILATILLYPGLPAEIPYHWGIGGSGKTIEKWFVFITAPLPGFIYCAVKLRSKKDQAGKSPFLTSLLVLIIHWVIIFIANR
jgi:uncharacterized membrane protein